MRSHADSAMLCSCFVGVTLCYRDTTVYFDTYRCPAGVGHICLKSDTRERLGMRGHGALPVKHQLHQVLHRFCLPFLLPLSPNFRSAAASHICISLGKSEPRCQEIRVRLKWLGIYISRVNVLELTSQVYSFKAYNRMI